MPTYNLEDAAKLKHVNALAQLTKSKLDETFKSLSVSGNTVSFFASTDGTGTALATFDFPEELFLDQTGTTLVDNFTFSAATYPGATNPNLDGKVVLVLAVKGDATTPTVKYSFVDMAKLVDAYTAANESINISGTSIAVKISATNGNLLSLANDGLLVDHDATKVDKVTNAVTGNIVTFGVSGAVVDSGITFASDSAVIAMLNDTFGAGSISQI